MNQRCTVQAGRQRDVNKKVNRFIANQNTLLGGNDDWPGLRARAQRCCRIGG